MLDFLKVDEVVSVHGAVRTGGSFLVRDTVLFGSLLSVYAMISLEICIVRVCLSLRRLNSERLSLHSIRIKSVCVLRCLCRRRLRLLLSRLLLVCMNEILGCSISQSVNILYRFSIPLVPILLILEASVILSDGLWCCLVSELSSGAGSAACGFPMSLSPLQHFLVLAFVFCLEYLLERSSSRVWNRVGISLSVYLLSLLKNGEPANGEDAYL